MKIVYISAAFVLGLTAMGCAAEATDLSTQPEQSSAQAPTSQERLAQTTERLENAFNDQFVRGEINPSALTGHINDVVAAMPEAARPTVANHIQEVVASGQALTSRMTPEERAQAVAPVPTEALGTTEQGLIGGFGWGRAGGWGGYGAFGFPGMYGRGGLGWGRGIGWGGGLGWGRGIGWGGGLGWGRGVGWGGIGRGGWFW